MTKTPGPKGAADTDDDTVEKSDVVIFQGEYWVVAGCFGKYYNRWALVTEAVPLKSTHRVMLINLLVNPVAEPYVRYNTARTNWAMVTAADKCQHAGHMLIFSPDAGTQAKRFKAGPDMWAL